jgi:site-specific DNA-methyltransferase (adenine-specific)/adenine-specific DNA-methyltransferase
MTPEQRQEFIRLLEQGEEISSEWARILFPPEKREYELVYHGKEREEDILANTLAVPLQPVRTFGKKGGPSTGSGQAWHNMLIFGDNLQVMKSLLELKKAGKLCNSDGTPGVRLVYIDPPFATKQEFHGTEDQKAYQDKIVGSRFLEFLRKRLVFLKHLLSDDGAIYVHVDWKKSHYVRAILDDVLGEDRFINEIIWYYSNKYGANSDAFDSFHNTLFRFGRGKKFLYEPIRIPVKTPRLQPLRAWNKELNKNEWLRGPDGKYLYKESKEKDAGDVWEIPVINPMAVERLGYPTQKPELLLDWVIRSSTGKGDLIIDAFVGSGTTCAVGEKLDRRWIGIDCGKLAIYTVQRRMLNLRKEIGNKGPAIKAKPFTLYNAGLYDFSKLRELPWESWRFFALQLFQCRDEPHRIGGVQLEGYLKGASVLVFNHQKQLGVRIDEETIRSLHEALGSRVGSRMFIVAPAMTFDFQQDYIDMGDVRYYALRIPYSIIHELHQREFTALKQPSDELAVNDTVEAVGFDFIRRPELEYDVGVSKRKGQSSPEAFIRIKTFKSEAVVREPMRKKGNRETLSMVMLDYDFDTESDIFGLDAVFYADGIENAGWEIRFPAEPLGEKVMAVVVDIYGNEARELIPVEKFGLGRQAKENGSKRTVQKKARK